MSERIAVIIPCYNHQAFIGEAIESVLRQTHKADRILVIDDGSKDDSPKVLERYVAQGVEVWCRENRGAHETLNELVRKAAEDCQYIQILNSDDRFLPDRLAFCLQMAREHPEKSVFSTGLRVIDGQGEVMPEDSPRARWFHGAWSLGKQEGITMAEWLGQANFVATTTNVFAKAEYLLKYPFRPYRFNHDYFFLGTAVLEDQLVVDTAVHAEYRVHGSNTIATKPAPLIREMLRFNLDLYHHHAGQLRKDPAVRDRFYDFVRGGFNSISSLHAGMLQVALAQLIAEVDEKRIEQLCQELDGPEFEEFPNRVLAGAYDGKSPLNAGAALGKRLESLKGDLVKAKQDRDAVEKLARLRQKLLASNWVRLGLLLGVAKPLASNQGKNAAEKLNHLSQACRKNGWLRLGGNLGLSTAKELVKGEP